MRTLYEYTGMCFAITLKGPDGSSDVVNSYGDGQGIVMDEMNDVLAPEVWAELERIGPEFVRINPDFEAAQNQG